jgi:DNA-directed RNA polymerase specialized sigma24 family protein
MCIIFKPEGVDVGADRSSSDGKEGAQLAALHGVLALLVDARESRIAEDKNAVKTEVILRRVGLPVDDIADVMGKNPDDVRKAITRAKAA